MTCAAEAPACEGWTRIAAVLAVTLVIAAAIFLLPAVPQDAAYHVADRRAWLGVPNFGDVVSNVPFALVGALGLRLVLGRRATAAFAEPRERWAYVVFFAGVALTSLGSTYYHWAPDSVRLVWDRLPMTVGFTSLFAALVAERLGARAGLRVLGPLLAMGLASVLYWYSTEQTGAGDLRPYVLVQLYPMATTPLLMGLFHARYTRSRDFLGVAAMYGAALLFDLTDAAVYALGQVVSGHTLKHLAAAAAAYLVLRMLARRRMTDRRATSCLSSGAGGSHAPEGATPPSGTSPRKLRGQSPRSEGTTDRVVPGAGRSYPA